VAEFVATGRVVDLIVAVMVLEALILAMYRRKSGHGIAVGALLASLVPGLLLVLALRGALVGAGSSWILVCLAAAFAAHLFDLSQRWRRSGERG